MCAELYNLIVFSSWPFDSNSNSNSKNCRIYLILSTIEKNLQLFVDQKNQIMLLKKLKIETID